MSAPVVITNMLDATYRCDRCSAQAFVMYALKPTERCLEGELFFCRHHAAQYAAALDPLAEFIADESYRLNENRLTGAH